MGAEHCSDAQLLAILLGSGGRGYSALDNRLRDAHTALDTAVRAAYGMSATEDTLAFL